MKGSYIEKGSKILPLDMARNTFYLPTVICPSVAVYVPDSGGATGYGAQELMFQRQHLQ